MQETEVTGSILNGVMGIFIDIILKGRYGPGVTQHMTEVSTRNISWGVMAVGAYG